MSRSQKYKPRERHLYALMFDSKRVYIGQTIDIGRRHKEHRRDWNYPFQIIELGSIVGTQADAEEYEYAWRYRAGRSGFRVLCKSPTSADVFEINPARRMDRQKHRIASTLKWPEEHRAGWGWWPWIAFAAALLLLLAFWPSIGKPLAAASSSHVSNVETASTHHRAVNPLRLRHARS